MTTATGMLRRTSDMRPLFEHRLHELAALACGSISLGAMPPTTYKPPVGSTLSARLPASAPYSETNSETARTHAGSVAVTAAPADHRRRIAGREFVLRFRAWSWRAPARVTNAYSETRPGPETTRSTDTRPWWRARRKLQQLDLELVARREVGVAAFARQHTQAGGVGTAIASPRPVPAPISAIGPSGSRLPSASGPDRRGERADAERGGCEVVEQRHRRVELLRSSTTRP